MSITEFGALGEGIGSMLILVTLIYLAVQNRHQQKLLLSTVSQARTDALRDMLRGVSEIADVYVKLQNEEPLTPTDTFRLFIVRNGQLRNFENTHYQGLLGAVSHETLRMSRNNLKESLVDHSYRSQWANSSHRYSSPFSSWVNEIIQEIEQEATA